MVLVDTHVILDVATDDPRWSEWSSRKLVHWYDYRAIPREAAFLAARAHAAYRERGGTRQMILPDFLIGAHALVENLALLTRDGRRYRQAFPGLKLITPQA